MAFRGRKPVFKPQEQVTPEELTFLRSLLTHNAIEIPLATLRKELLSRDTMGEGKMTVNSFMEVVHLARPSLTMSSDPNSSHPSLSTILEKLVPPGDQKFDYTLFVDNDVYDPQVEARTSSLTSMFHGLKSECRVVPADSSLAFLLDVVGASSNPSLSTFSGLPPSSLYPSSSPSDDQSTIIALDFDQTLTLVRKQPLGNTSSSSSTTLPTSSNSVAASHPPLPHSYQSRLELRGGEATRSALTQLYARGVPMCIVTAQAPTVQTMRNLQHELQHLGLAKLFDCEPFDRLPLLRYLAGLGDDDTMDIDTLAAKCIALILLNTSRVSTDLARMAKSQVVFTEQRLPASVATSPAHHSHSIATSLPNSSNSTTISTTTTTPDQSSDDSHLLFPSVTFRLISPTGTGYTAPQTMTSRCPLPSSSSTDPLSIASHYCDDDKTSITTSTTTTPLTCPSTELSHVQDQSSQSIPAATGVLELQLDFTSTSSTPLSASKYPSSSSTSMSSSSTSSLPAPSLPPPSAPTITLPTPSRPLAPVISNVSESKSSSTSLTIQPPPPGTISHTIDQKSSTISNTHKYPHVNSNNQAFSEDAFIQEEMATEELLRLERLCPVRTLYTYIKRSESLRLTYAKTMERLANMSQHTSNTDDNSKRQSDTTTDRSITTNNNSNTTAGGGNVLEDRVFVHTVTSARHASRRNTVLAAKAKLHINTSNSTPSGITNQSSVTSTVVRVGEPMHARDVRRVLKLLLRKAGYTKPRSRNFLDEPVKVHSYGGCRISQLGNCLAAQYNKPEAIEFFIFQKRAEAMLDAKEERDRLLRQSGKGKQGGDRGGRGGGGYLGDEGMYCGFLNNSDSEWSEYERQDDEYEKRRNKRRRAGWGDKGDDTGYEREEEEEGEEEEEEGGEVEADMEAEGRLMRHGVSPSLNNGKGRDVGGASDDRSSSRTLGSSLSASPKAPEAERVVVVLNESDLKSATHPPHKGHRRNRSIGSEINLVVEKKIAEHAASVASWPRRVIFVDDNSDNAFNVFMDFSIKQMNERQTKLSSMDVLSSPSSSSSLPPPSCAPLNSPIVLSHWYMPPIKSENTDKQTQQVFIRLAKMHEGQS